MFVSSYSAYVNPNSSIKTQNELADVSKKTTPSFGSKLLQTVTKNIPLGKELPLNYISNYKALNNRQRLEQQDANANFAKTKFTTISSTKNAQVAYSDNSTIFSLLIKPKQTLNQTPKVNANFPVQVQQANEQLTRNVMINTYISNDNYYKITA